VRFATTPNPFPGTCLISNGCGVLFGAARGFGVGSEGPKAGRNRKSLMRSGEVRIEIPRDEEKFEDV